MNTEDFSRKNTKNSQIIGYYPIRLLRFILKKLRIKDLFTRYIQDPRSRVDDYHLTPLMIHSLLMHLFRSPSKNGFQQNFLRAEASSIAAKFSGMDKNRVPCVRTLDDLFLKLNPEDFKPILPAIFRSLCRSKLFQLHPEFIPEGEYAIAVDAQVTHTYYPHSQHPCQHCPYCLKRTQGNNTWYLHLDLVASFVAPNGLQIPLLFHRIRARPNWELLSEDKWKQECERTAFPILIKELRRQFPRLHFCIHLDSLYATDHILTLLEELKMGYSIVRKAKVLKTVGEDCQGLKMISSPLKIDKKNKRFNTHQIIHFFNDIPFKKHSLHVVELEEEAKKKPSKRFAKVQLKKAHWEWLVHQNLNNANAVAVASNSRIRWKEEDLFNDLQQRGFAICHDFNRAPTAQSVRSFLILIAYAVTSILVHSSLGRSILSKGYTVTFIMKQMLTDLIYTPETILFHCRDPTQLRFDKRSFQTAII